MRQTRIFIGLAAMMIGFCLTACASENTDNIINPDAQLDGAKIRDSDPIGEDHDGVPEIDVDKDIDWSEDELDGDHAENPGMHDGYYHEVGGARFYTEHDINQWLKPDNKYPRYLDFDIGQMLIDLWCQDGGGIIENNVGFSYTDGEEWTKGVWFEVPDADNDRLYHMVTIMNVYDGVEYTTSISMNDCPGPYTETYYSILNNYTHIIHKDLAPLILLAIEKMDANPYDGALNDLNLNENFQCN